ncbi:unnamed protein product [Didymodactylos carnosus]|uniref:Uncharacterized protein n=1 Tax=Didymodactylos carnosus TaxID=1234261 RepID=A0A8S2VNM2_9BILA|nr:unnamed protein product [Didymodactylos carnosus]
MAALADCFCDAEGLIALKDFMNQLGCETVCVKELFFKRWRFILSSAKRPLIILGSAMFQRQDTESVYAATVSLANKLRSSLTDDNKEWHIFNVLHRYASQVAALDLGYKPDVKSIIELKPKLLYLFGADGGLIKRQDLPNDCYIIYQGHHGDHGALMADAILPEAGNTEKQGIYANTEGRAQQTHLAVCGLPLPYNDIDDVRARIDQVAPNLTRINTIEEANYFKQNIDLLQNHKTSFTDSALTPPITELKEFYMTDPISRASLTMAKCVKAVEEQLKSRHT